MENNIHRSFKNPFLFAAAVILLSVVPVTSHAQQTTSAAGDLADNSVDAGDIVGGDYAATPTIQIDDATDLVITVDLANPVANNDLIQISNGGGSLTVNSGVTLSASGTGDVINADDNDATIVINGTLSADGSGQDAINLGALTAGQQGNITINGGAGNNGNITGWITGGDDADTLVLNTTGGNITLAGGEIDLGAGADILTFQGANTVEITGDTLAADTINISGTGIVDIQSTTTTGDLNFTQDGTLRLSDGQTLTGNIDNSTGGSLGTIVVTGGDVDIDGRFGATNRIKRLELNGTGTTTFLTATPGQFVDHNIDTIHFAEDATLHMGVNDSSIDSNITVATDGIGSFTQLQNSSISRNIGAENLRLGRLEISSGSSLGLRNGIEEVWVKDIELNHALATISFDENGLNVNADRILNTNGVNHSGRVRTTQGATLNISQMGTTDDRLEQLFILNNGGAGDGQTVTLNTDTGFFQRFYIDQDQTRVNLGKATTVLTFTNTINLAGTNPILGITVDGTQASKIVIDGGGNAVDLEDFQIVVISEDGGDIGFIPNGTQIVIAEGQAAATAPTKALQGGGDNYNFTMAADGNNIVLTTQRSKTFENQVTDENNKDVGVALETIGNTADTGINALQDRLQTALNNDTAIDGTLETLTPTVDGSIAYTTANTTNQSLGTVVNRLTQLRTGASVTGLSAGDRPLDQQVWTQAFGRLARQDSKKGVGGYDADTYGLAAGYDAPVLDDAGRAGLAFSYARSNVDGKSLYDTDIDSYQATLYGQYELENLGYKSAFVEAMTAYTFSANDTVRYDVGGTGDNATSDYNTHQYTLQAQLGKNYSYGSNVTLTPKALVHFMHYDPSDYSESGVSGLGLDVSPDNQNVLELGVGGTVSASYKTLQGGEVTPSLSLGYRYDLISDTPSSTANFIGAADTLFKTEGVEAEPHSLNVGAGLNYSYNEQWDFTASYDFQYKQDYKAHAGMIKMQYRF